MYFKDLDLNSDRMAELQRRGAIAAISPAQAVSEITIVLLPSAIEVRAAVYGEHGVLSGMKPGSTLIDLNGTDPDCARELDCEIAARGGYFVGGTVHAAGAPATTIPQGKISLVIGGKKRALDNSIDVLDHLARKIICVPEPWIPKSMKLAIIMFAAIESAATAEIMTWLVGQEIDPRMFLDVIRVTGSNATQRVEEFFRRHERTGGTLSNIRKDLRQSLSVARDKGVPLLVTSLVDQLAETAAKCTGDRIRPSAAFAALYEAMVHVDMSQSVVEAVNAEVRDAPQSKVVYVGNFRE